MCSHQCTHSLDPNSLSKHLVTDVDQDTMNTEHQPRPECAIVHEAIERLQGLRIQDPPLGRQTDGDIVRRRASRDAQELCLNNTRRSRRAFICRTRLLQRAANLGRLGNTCVDLRFWDPSRSSWVGVRTQSQGMSSHSGQVCAAHFSLSISHSH